MEPKEPVMNSNVLAQHVLRAKGFKQQSSFPFKNTKVSKPENLNLTLYSWSLGSPGGSVVKNPLANAGNVGLIPGSGRSPAEGHGNPLQCTCLGNLTDRGAWWGYSSQGCKESDSI